MNFVKYNELRKVLAPHYGKSIAEKCKVLWDEGWTHNPIPTLTLLCVPIIIAHGTWEYFFHDTSKYKRKYLENPPIYRPGDPRIAEIQHYSGLDP